METKKLVLIVVSIFVLSIAFSNKLHAEYRLEFDSIDCPKQIVIPHSISETVGYNFAKCRINYTYHGTLISDGKMRRGSSKIDRNCIIHATILYLDKKNNALMVLTKPEEGEAHDSDDIYILGMNVMFLDDERYNVKLLFLNSNCLNQKRINRLLREKKIKKIAIEIDKIIVDWTYEYSEYQDEEDVDGKRKDIAIIRKGKFDFKVGKKVSIKVNYENEKK